MVNEYAVSIYDGHKEEWTLMGCSAWGWCYAPLLLTTFIAQTTVPSPCEAMAWPSASEFTFAPYNSINSHVSTSSAQETYLFEGLLGKIISWMPVIWIDKGNEKSSNIKSVLIARGQLTMFCISTEQCIYEKIRHFLQAVSEQQFKYVTCRLISHQ